MEMLTNKEVMPLTIKLIDKEDERLTYDIKMALLDEVNSYLGISAQEVLKLLINGLKKPNKENVDYCKYVRNATIWVIKNKRQQVSKEIGKFVNILEYHNDFRERGYDDKDQVNKKYFELLCYHIATENPFITLKQLQEIHKTCLQANDTLPKYLRAFEERLERLNVPIPKEHIMMKAKQKIEEWDKIFSELEDEE